MQVQTGQAQASALSEVAASFEALRENVRKNGPKTALLLAKMGRSVQAIRRPKP